MRRKFYVPLRMMSFENLIQQLKNGTRLIERILPELNKIKSGIKSITIDPV
jgi:hypothetical protein